MGILVNVKDEEMVIMGILVNVKDRSITIPSEKMQELLVACDEAYELAHLTKCQLSQRHGKLCCARFKTFEHNFNGSTTFTNWTGKHDCEVFIDAWGMVWGLSGINVSILCSCLFL